MMVGSKLTVSLCLKFYEAYSLLKGIWDGGMKAQPYSDMKALKYWTFYQCSTLSVKLHAGRTKNH